MGTPTKLKQPLALNAEKLLVIAEDLRAEVSTSTFVTCSEVPIGELNGVVFYLSAVCRDEAEDRHGFEQVLSNFECLTLEPTQPLDAMEDDRYPEAKAAVMNSGRASISYVQRKLVIGYNRAARLLQRMEDEGMLKPMDDKGVRAIVVAASGSQGGAA